MAQSTISRILYASVTSVHYRSNKAESTLPMAEMTTKWQKTIREDYVDEYFWQGKFIQSDQWRAPSRPEYEGEIYSYRKDGFSYNGTIYTFDNEIQVTEMTHATSFECMRSIIKEGGFRSQEKQYPGIGSMSLVWFGLKIGEREIDRMKESSNCRVQAIMQDKPELKAAVLDQIARTPAFQPISLYGHFKFTIGIQEVMNAYTTQFCKGFPHPEMKMLGTFDYTNEIMHAILVCPPNTPGTDIYPPLSSDPVIQPDAMLETWTWKPHSTGYSYVEIGGNDAYSINIKWEHVSFAFYVPKGNRLSILDLDRCVSLCNLSTVRYTISGVEDDIKRMLDLIVSTEVTNRISVADMLISMIAGYLKDERLYKKTMINGDNYFVPLELVIQCIRKLSPPLAFEALDWGPLTEWMNSLTIHSNVIRDIQRARIKCWQDLQ